jgi:anti-sigma28 factor (negative regulator of flagellin synthesis)
VSDGSEGEDQMLDLNPSPEETLYEDARRRGELSEEVETMVNEIMNELNVPSNDTQDAVGIKLGPINSDLVDPAEQERARLAHLKRQIQAGTYRVDPLAIARGIMLRGDL